MCECDTGAARPELNGMGAHIECIGYSNQRGIAWPYCDEKFVVWWRFYPLPSKATFVVILSIVSPSQKIPAT